MPATDRPSDTDLAVLCQDLADEHASLDAVVATLTDEAWDLPTPSQGWAIRDQVSHLAFFDEIAVVAATDADRMAEELAAAQRDVDAYMSTHLVRGREMRPDELLDWWRRARTTCVDVLSALDGDSRVPWFGPPLKPVDFVTGRLMETWAHGQDVVDAVGASRQPTDRLRHIAFLGVRTLRHSYRLRGMDAPAEPVRVELRSPAGKAWAWGDEAARDRVRGDALNFCLVVTQRRNVADTELAVVGPVATEWLSFAQAYAGEPGGGRPPGRFPRAGDRG